MGNAPTRLNFEKFDTLWNQGRFGEARQLLYEMNNHGHGSRDVQYWLKRAMAELMFGNYDDAEDCMKDARTCPGWREAYEVNYHRDLALAYIRDRDIHLTTGTIEVLLKPMTVSDDPNDVACANMILGRHMYEQARRTQGKKQNDRLDEALVYFAKAEEVWAGMDGPVNEQWRMNNNYHWFKTMRMRRSAKAITWGHDKSDTSMVDLYGHIRKDPNKKRRRAAALILFTGRFGLWLERRVA